MDWCLQFNKFSALFEGFCNANWVSNNDEVSSTSGYVFTLCGGAILWKYIARSTIEVEFIALELVG